MNQSCVLAEVERGQCIQLAIKLGYVHKGLYTRKVKNVIKLAVYVQNGYGLCFTILDLTIAVSIHAIINDALLEHRVREVYYLGCGGAKKEHKQKGKSGFHGFRILVFQYTKFC